MVSYTLNLALDRVDAFRYHVYMTTRTQLIDFTLRGLKETSTYTKAIAPLLQDLGFSDYSLDSIEEDYEVAIDTQRVWIDRCLKKEGVPIAFLQVKRLGYSSFFDSDFEKTMQAAKKASIPLVIFSSGDVWEIYKTGKLVCKQNLLNNFDDGIFEITNLLKLT